MNQNLLGILRAIGYPIIFGILSTLISILPGVATMPGFPTWLPAAFLVALIGIGEHALANKVGYNLPAGSVAVPKSGRY